MTYILTKCPAVFIDLMNRVFEEYLDKFVIVFITDGLVHPRTLEEYELHLKIALGKIEREEVVC